MQRQTTIAKNNEIQRKWYVVSKENGMSSMPQTNH